MNSYLFFFFWWILEMDLNFFLCSLSLFSCYNQKQRKSESHFPPTFGVYFFQLTFPSSCFSFVCNFVQSLFRHHSIQQIQGDYGITQPVQIPAGHLLVMQTQAGSFTHLPSGSSLVFRNRSISLL